MSKWFRVERRDEYIVIIETDENEDVFSWELTPEDFSHLESAMDTYYHRRDLDWSDPW